MKTAVVELSNPIGDFLGKTVKRIVLREPTYSLYARFGELYTYGRTAEGTEFATARDDVIAEYLDRCVIEPEDSSVLQLVNNVKDARALRAALAGFFHDTAEADTSGPQQS